MAAALVLDVRGAPQGPGHKIAKTTPCKVE
jgi:hypothetical protein